MASKRITVLAGDGIGREIVPAALRVLRRVWPIEIELTLVDGLMGGRAIDETGSPLPDDCLEQCRASDAVLLGAVGGPQWDSLPMNKKPEAGLLKLRSGMECFANLRPANTFGALIEASSLKQALVNNLDLMIVRELTGGIYFGEPRGFDSETNSAFNTMRYNEEEITRIGKIAFDIARLRDSRVCSVDKANVLDVSQFWRETIIKFHEQFGDIDLTHLYVDNAAMQLVSNPKQFDVIVTSNLFGDILSDIAATLTGSIGMLPSASLNARNQGIYEPVHGTAPDIAGQNLANPLAMFLCVAMMLRYTFQLPQGADRIENAVEQTLNDGFRTGDIMPRGDSNADLKLVGTDEMTEAVLSVLG